MFSVVAPWFGPCAQVSWKRCIDHQMPMYFIGRIHEVSSIFEGSLRLSISREVTRSPGLSPTMIVRHGVRNGVRA